MRPGARLARSLAWLCAGALLVPFLPGLAWGVLAGVALLLGAAALEAALLRRVTTSVERAPAHALSLGEEETVSCLVRTDAARSVHLTVRQVWPSLLEPGASARSGVCRPGEVMRIDFTVRGIERGRAHLPPPHVGFTFRGLIERVVPAGEGSDLSVLPNLKSVRRLHAALNQFVLRGLGNRAAARLGKGREFDRLREYVLDDDFRDIAWKASARHRKLIVREFRLDRTQDILVCLDHGHRMAARVAHLTRLDHAVNAALLVAYICNRMEDRMSVLSFANDVAQGPPPGRGASHLRHVTSFVTPLRPDYRHTDYLALAAHVKRRLRHRALILILTALPELEDHHALVRAVGMLAPQHLPLLVAFADPELRAAARFLPATREELCRSLVARDLWTSRETVIRELRRRGAQVVEADPGDAGVEAVNAYLSVKRRQML